MADIDDFDGSLNKELDRLSNEIDALSKKEFQAKQVAINKCQQFIKRIATLIESYDLEIHNLDRAQAINYQDSLKNIENRFNTLKNKFEAKKVEGTDKEALFNERKNQPNANEMNAQQLIELGDKTLDAGIDKMGNIIGTVNQGIVLANEINVELDRQIEQLGKINFYYSLDRMHNTVKDTQTILKRSQVLIRYFARQVYTDKLIMGLICLIFLAIVVIVILSMMGKDKEGRFNVPDSIKL